MIPPINRIFLIIAAIIMVATVGGCGHQATDTRLDRAEAMIHDNPAEALSLLRDSIDATGLAEGSELQARHALLLSQALDKNRIDLTNDSLIAIATDYYSTHRDDLRLMLADYYRGRVIYNSGNYPEAIMHYLKALEIAEADSDHYWIGLISREISESYSPSYNCAEEVHYAQKAFDHMRLIGKHSYTCSTMARLIRALYDKGEYDKGLLYSFQLKDTVETYNIQKHEKSAYCLIGEGYLLLENDKKALPFLELAARHPEATILDTAYLGLALVSTGEITKAMEIHQKIETDSNLATIELKSKIYQAVGDYEKAYNALTILDSLTNNKFDRILGSDIPRLITEQLEEDKKVAEYRESAANAKLTIIIALTIALVAMFIFLTLRTYRRQKMKIERNIAIAENLREILRLKENDNTIIVNNLLASHFDYIDSLCKICYETRDKSALRAKISNEVTNLIGSLTDHNGKLGELESLADSLYDGVLTDFKRNFPGLKEIDYHLFLFSIFGFSTTAIALLLNEDKIDSVYNRRARLKNRIKLSNIPDVNRFLRFL